MLHLRLPSHVLDSWLNLETGGTMKFLATSNAGDERVQRNLMIQRLEGIADIKISELEEKQMVLSRVEYFLEEASAMTPQTSISQSCSFTRDCPEIDVDEDDENHNSAAIVDDDNDNDDDSDLDDVRRMLDPVKQEPHNNDYICNDLKTPAQGFDNNLSTVAQKSNLKSMGTLTRKVRKSRNQQWSCPGCSVIAPNRQCLLSHLKRKHKDDKDIWTQYEEIISKLDKNGVTIECPVCHKQRQGQSIFKHMTIVHGDMTDFEEIYKKVKAVHQEMFLRENREKGVLRSRENRRKAKAVNAGKPVKRGRPKKSEVKGEARSRKHSCPGCTSSFTLRSSLLTHIKKVHGGDHELMCKLEQTLSANYAQGAETQCLVCGQLRRGKTILKHFEVAHEDHPNYTQLYDQMARLYAERSAQLKQISRREKTKQKSMEKEKMISQEIQALSTLTVESLTTDTCLFCHCFVASQVELTNHVYTVHNLAWVDYNQMTADYANLTSKEPLHPELVEKYTKTICGLCAVIFSKGEGKVTFARHLKEHNLRKSEYLELLQQDCGARSRYFTQVKSRKTFHCPVCDHGFTLLNNLRSHVRRAHEDDPTALVRLEEYQALTQSKGSGVTHCLVCGQARTGTAIIKHVRTAHAEVENLEVILSKTKAMLRSTQKAMAVQRSKGRGVVQHTCKHCQEVFTCRTSKFRHQVSCEKNPNKARLMRCKMCSYWTQFPERLDSHMQKCHAQSQQRKDPQICHLCGKTYQRRSSLLVHLGNVHHVTKNGPAKRFECPVCNKEFIHSSCRFKEHLATHSEERNHICSSCGKCFKTMESLKSHTRLLHENRYPYRCSKCGHGVQHKRYLDTHICRRVRRQQENSVIPPQLGGEEGTRGVVDHHSGVPPAVNVRKDGEVVLSTEMTSVVGFTDTQPTDAVYYNPVMHLTLPQ